MSAPVPAAARQASGFIGPMFHKHGGKITVLTHIGHEIYDGVAEWFFRGRVEWQDGSVSEDIAIPPYALCHDDTPESTKAVHDALAKLDRYLQAYGNFHEPKHKKDGRVVHWTPKSRVRKSLLNIGYYAEVQS